MFKIWNADNFRRSMAGVSLVLAPVLFAGAEMIGPDSSGDAATQLATYTQHRGALLAAVLLGFGSSLLFIPAVFGLLHLVRERGVVYMHLGVAMVVYGAVAAAGLWGVNLAFAAMAAPGMDHTAMVALLDELQRREPAAAVLLLGHYMFAIGAVLLGVGLWRAHLAPRWAAVLVILFPVTDVLLSFLPIGDLGAGVVSNACGIIGFAGLGLKLLASPDLVWNQKPVRPEHATVPVPPV